MIPLEIKKTHESTYGAACGKSTAHPNIATNPAKQLGLLCRMKHQYDPSLLIVATYIIHGWDEVWNQVYIF